MASPTVTTRADNSLMGDMVCDTRVALRHIHGRNSLEEAAAAKAGQAAHASLAVYLQTRSRDGALVKFAYEYAAWSQETTPDPLTGDPVPRVADDDRLSFKNLVRVLEEWYSREPLRQYRWEILDIEKGFELPIDDTGELIFTGRLDVIVRDLDTGGLWVVDHKTRSSITDWWKDKFVMDSQMSGYAWAASKLYGEPVTGVYINALEFRKLPSGPKKCNREPFKHGLPYDECGGMHAKFDCFAVMRTPMQLRAWHQNAVRRITRYRNLKLKFDSREKLRVGILTGDLEMQGTFTGACDLCAFRKWCWQGRATNQIDVMTVLDRWDPVKEAA
jgi:hypothetical protein